MQGVYNVKYFIQVTNEEGVQRWNEEVGLFGRRESHSPTVFDNLPECEAKMKQLQDENPAWYVQRKNVR